MSISIRLLAMMILMIFSPFAFSQTVDFRYQMDGSFPAPVTSVSVPRMVTYSLFWNENEGAITGVYKDDFFTAAKEVTGTAGAMGRVFSVALPRIIQGVSNVRITANVPSLTGGTLPAVVLLQDSTSTTLKSHNISTVITVRSDFIEPATSPCDIGFGALSGYCGLYQGTFRETADTNNLCNIPSYGFRLELSADARTNLFFYFSSTVIGIPTHPIGGFTSAPAYTRVDLSNRYCGPLPGVAARPESCLNLNLSGNYAQVSGGRNFVGTYTVTDERTKDSCTYELDVTRDRAY